MMRQMLFILAFLLMVFPLQAQDCNNFWPEVSEDGQYMYFTSDKAGGVYEIYRVNTDGSNELRLTNFGLTKYFPSVSPDGSKVVFQTSEYGSSAEIWIMDNDGSNLLQLTDNSTYDGNPSFSPDGLKIIFDAWDGSAYPEIFTMNPDGTGRTQITNQSGAYWQSAPKFNPQGNKIYFSAGFNADNHYVMMDLDGSNWVDITPPNSFGYSDGALDFNADGSKILFFTTEWKGYNNGGDLVIADADGSNWNRLTEAENGEYFYRGSFHPNGTDIFYTYYYPPSVSKWEIHRMDTAGNNRILFSGCALTPVEEVGVAESNFILSPNPTSGWLSIEIPESFNSIRYLEIYSLSGRLIYSEVIKSNDGILGLDLSGQTPGIYIVRLRSEEEIMARKLVLTE